MIIAECVGDSHYHHLYHDRWSLTLWRNSNEHPHTHTVCNHNSIQVILYWRVLVVEFVFIPLFLCLLLLRIVYCYSLTQLISPFTVGQLQSSYNHLTLLQEWLIWWVHLMEIHFSVLLGSSIVTFLVFSSRISLSFPLFIYFYYCFGIDTQHGWLFPVHVDRI